MPLQEIYPGLAGKINAALDTGFDEDAIQAKILERIGEARNSGFSQVEIEEYMGVTPLEATREPVQETPAPSANIQETAQRTPVTPQIDPNVTDFEAISAGSPLGASLEAVPDEILPGVGKRLRDEGVAIVRPFLAQAYKSAETLNKGVESFSRNLDLMADYIGAKTGLKSGGLFDEAAKVYKSNAGYWNERGKEVGVNIVDELIGEAVGGAGPGIAEFMLNAPYAMLRGAAEAEKAGKSEFKGAFYEGAKRYLLGKIFHAAGQLKQPAGSIVMGGTMATETAIAGGSQEEIAKSAGIGALYGIGSGGKVGVKDLARRRVPADGRPRFTERSLVELEEHLRKAEVKPPTIETKPIKPPLKLEGEVAPKAKKKAEQVDLLKVQPKAPEGKIKPKVAQKESEIPLIAEPKTRAMEAKQVKIGEKPKPPLKKSSFNPEKDSLLDFVRKEGGFSTIKEGALKGELKGYFSIKEGINLLNNKTGRSVDAMSELVAEAGFFKGKRPTPAELIDALQLDVSAKLSKETAGRVRHPRYDFEADIEAKAAADFDSIAKEPVKSNDIWEGTKEIDGYVVPPTNWDLLSPLKSEKGSVDISVTNKLVPAIRKKFGLVDAASKLYQAGTSAVENWRIHRNTGALKATNLGDKIREVVPSAKERAEITHALDSPSKAAKLNKRQKVVYDKMREMYDNYATKLESEGIMEAFRENYVNHIIIESPLKGRGAKGGGGTLTTKPSFTRQRRQTPDGRDFTLEEWKAMGYKVHEDISSLASLYSYSAELAITNKRLVEYVKKAKADDGSPALQVFSKIPFEKKGDYLYIDEMQLQKYAGKTIKAGKDKKATLLFTEPTGLHKDLWPTIDNVLRDRRPPGAGLKAFYKFRGGVKRVIMFNPLIHGFNVESNVIMALGLSYPHKRFKSLFNMTPEKIQAVKIDMVTSGMEVEGLFDVGRRLNRDAYELKVPSTKSLQSTLLKPLSSLRKGADHILWDRWIGSGQMLIFETLKGRFKKGEIIYEGGLKFGRKKTMTDVEAGRSAAMMANDLMGTLPSTWFTKNQRKYMFNLMFARNWTVSNLRTLTGATGGFARSGALPKFLRFENVTDAQMKAMSSQYRRVLLKGVIGAIATTNAIQYLLQKINSPDDIRPTWRNETGHKLDIDTGLLDNEGNKIYIKNWLFRQIDDYAKLIEGHPIKFTKAKAEPIMRTIAEIMLNVDYRGKEIVPRGEDLQGTLKRIGAHMLTGVTPVDTFTGREGEVRTLIEKILPFTGTWVRKGMPTGSKDPAMGDLLLKFYEYKNKKALLSEPLKKKASELIQQGKDAEAGKLVDEVLFTEQQALNVQKKIKDPFAYRQVLWIDKKGVPHVSSDLKALLLGMPEKERNKYTDAIRRHNMKRYKNKEE